MQEGFLYSELPKWQKEIIEKYPRIYLESVRFSSSPDQNPKNLSLGYCSLRSGFECGPGWRELIEQLSTIADQLVTKLRDSGLQPDAAICPIVIKNKFGQLRWQGHHRLSPPFDVLWKTYVAQIKRESAETCELSGQPGTIRDVNGFRVCLSDEEYQHWETDPQIQRHKYGGFVTFKTENLPTRT